MAYNLLNRKMNPTKLPAAKLIRNMPSLQAQLQDYKKGLIAQMIGGNILIFGAYKLSTGPRQERFKRMCTVTPGSNATSVLFFHAAHTHVAPLLVNCGALATLGLYHWRTLGQQSFLRVFGAGCLAASLAVGASTMVNPD